MQQESSGRFAYSNTLRARQAPNLIPGSRRQLVLALSLALGGSVAIGSASDTAAQTFPPVLQLPMLNGTNGFRLDGAGVGERFGGAVSAAGDVNSDGIDDLLIGAPLADPNGVDRAGRSYVVFGSRSGFAAMLNLSNLDGTNGFRLDGVAELDRSGMAVSGAGDVNGDGIDDLLIGAEYADPNDLNSAGSSYAVFGSSNGFPASLNLSSLNGTNGFRLDGVAAGERSGTAVSAAGDVNGDGIDDLLIGAPRAGPNGVIWAGSSYVVFGNSSGFAATMDLGSLNGTNGFRIDGVAGSDRTGFAVSGAGDVNGDGIDDLLIGAPYADPNNNVQSGSSYVVFGSSSGFAATLNLGSLDGASGVRLDGVGSNDRSGDGVSGAGDVNGDGVSDVLIGAFLADPNGIGDSGSAYVVFGHSGGFAPALSLDSLNGTTGLRLDGAATLDFAGLAVSAAGDVNGDGIDDLLIGAFGADPNGNGEAGSSYVVFGRSSGFAATLPLGSLDGTSGFRLDGGAASSFSGYAVSAAGDVNGDGIDDVLIGAQFAGRSYVVFGREGIFADQFE